MSGSKVERWAVITPEGAIYPHFTEKAAQMSLKHFAAGSVVGRVQTVCAAHDASVRRLVEAARNAVPMMQMAWNQYGVGWMFECMDALRSALTALDAGQEAGPANGMRCWRNKGGPKWCDGTDRVRLRADGVCEWVWPNGRTELCKGVFRDAGYWQGRIDYVECADAPYVAPSAMPPEGMRTFVATDVPGRATPLMRETTPQPPAMETADAFADRVLTWSNKLDCVRIARNSEYGQVVQSDKDLRFGRSLLTEHISARDSAWQAKVDEARTTGIEAAKILTDQLSAKDAEIARLTKELASEWTLYDNECVRTSDLQQTVNDLRSKLSSAESKATGGGKRKWKTDDPELVAFLDAVERVRFLTHLKPGYRAAILAFAESDLHAALSAPATGEVGR